MSTTTLFIALQCSQCSTMQVKQQKRSSNKWVCVVCNQRQSVRRIHGQGHLARDVRGFVQRFNMSRMVHGSDGPDSIPIQPGGGMGSLAEAGVEENLGSPPPVTRKRTDWSEFLDPDEERGDEANGEALLEENITTESPPKKFARSFPKYPVRASAAPGDRAKPLKPTFSYKKRQNRGAQQDSDKAKRRRMTGAASGPSKWSEYLEGEDMDQRNCQVEGGSYSNFDGPQHSGEKSSFQDAVIIVEEEVHPDFK